MFSHVTLGVSNLARSRSFYDKVLEPLGLVCKAAGDDHVAYRVGSDPTTFWILLPFDNKRASAGNGTHIAFLAPNRGSVDEFHRQALAAGGSDEGAPGPRPHYHAHYYGAYIRDPDGNKLQACCHRPE